MGDLRQLRKQGVLLRTRETDGPVGCDSDDVSMLEEHVRVQRRSKASVLRFITRNPSSASYCPERGCVLDCMSRESTTLGSGLGQCTRDAPTRFRQDEATQYRHTMTNSARDGGLCHRYGHHCVHA